VAGSGWSRSWRHRHRHRGPLTTAWSRCSGVPTALCTRRGWPTRSTP
jgi:hypothetical protein